MSPNLKNTERYVNSIIKYNNSSEKEEKIPVIIQFLFSPIDWIKKGLKYKYFGKYDDEFVRFVFENRINCMKPKAHFYDITGGVTTDTKPEYLIELHKKGNITKEELFREFKRSTSIKQLCLHNQQQCDLLKPMKAYVFKGEESDINDYCRKK